MDAEVKASLSADGEVSDDDDDEVLLTAPLLAVQSACEATATATPSFSPSENTSELEHLDVALACEQRSERQYWPSWWDRYFLLYYDSSVTTLCIKLKAVGLRDADVNSLCLALDSLQARAVNPALPIVIELDASENKLSDVGGVQLVSWLCRLVATHSAGARVRLFKLYKNCVADDTCEALAALIMRMSEPVEEIHLSHNAIQQRGLVMILVALAMHPGCIYPRQTRNGPCPCWLRVEHNEIADTEELLSVLFAMPAFSVRTCQATRSDTGPSCTSFQCCLNSCSWENVAHAHLYCVHVQSVPSTSARHNTSKIINQVVADVGEGKLRFGKRPESFYGCPCVSNASSRDSESLPIDAVVCRDVILRVDGKCGAGIELEPGAHGYVVQKVDLTPGQDMQPGEVITTIDGLPLWGSMDIDELSNAFGSRFGEGAHIRVAVATELAGRCLWQPLGPQEVGARCGLLLAALQEDLSIMGHRCGARVDFHASDGAVSLRGPPQSQRWAVNEMLPLVGFYFPECAGASGLPSSHWHGSPDPLCAEPDETEVEVPNADKGWASSAEIAVVDHHDGAECDVKGLGDWQSTLQKQWSEDDNLFDEDLPCEPLEGPDDGPDTFEGEVLAPDFEALALPLRVLMLVGLPGSGKSTLAARLWDLGWQTINQDTLGDRRACVATARSALLAGKRVVIDRCNVSRIQRRVWLGIAEELQVCAGCLWLDVDAEECGNRVLRRFGHKTLPAEDSSLDVITVFKESLEAPVEAEGFVLWRSRCQDQLDNAIEEMQELADRSEVDAAEFAARDPQRVATVNGDRAPQCANRMDAVASGSFRYREVRGRGFRGQYLRAVRRQVEFYFCDGNLCRDWFFQEKIAEEPESGWLELCWILSCPRIRNVHKANDADVLDALGPSSLIVKQIDGVHWVRRGRPLPPLAEPRPSRGDEPDWYKALHGETASDSPDPAESIEPSVANRFLVLAESAPEEPRCCACGRERPKSAFSKAQLTKHRKTPTCKDCVN